MNILRKKRIYKNLKKFDKWEIQSKLAINF